MNTTGHNPNAFIPGGTKYVCVRRENGAWIDVGEVQVAPFDLAIYMILEAGEIDGSGDFQGVFTLMDGRRVRSVA